MLERSLEETRLHRPFLYQCQLVQVASQYPTGVYPATRRLVRCQHLPLLLDEENEGHVRRCGEGNKQADE